MTTRIARTDEETRAIGAELARLLRPGDSVLLEGALGAGKTTLVRGLLAYLGVREPVRSPTFNLLQVFDTDPPVLHADLFRVSGALGIGLEEYLESHVCLIEWPDRLSGLLDPEESWRVRIDVLPDESRSVEIVEPFRAR